MRLGWDSVYVVRKSGMGQEELARERGHDRNKEKS